MEVPRSLTCTKTGIAIQGDKRGQPRRVRNRRSQNVSHVVGARWHGKHLLRCKLQSFQCSPLERSAAVKRLSDPFLGRPDPGQVLFLAFALKVRWCFGVTAGSASSGTSHTTATHATTFGLVRVDRLSARQGLAKPMSCQRWNDLLRRCRRQWRDSLRCSCHPLVEGSRVGGPAVSQPRDTFPSRSKRGQGLRSQVRTHSVQATASTTNNEASTTYLEQQTFATLWTVSRRLLNTSSSTRRNDRR